MTKSSENEQKTEQNTTKNDEKEVDEGCKCPFCGATVKFIAYGRAPYVICPECNNRLSRRKVHPDCIDQRPAKGDITIKPKHKPADNDEEFEEDDEDEGIELIRKPKTPHQILREVLEEFGVKEDFIEIAVKRSKRLGGLHPTELRNMLIALKNSGVRDKDTAAFIADEYAIALQEEEKKASELGYTEIHYPTGVGHHDTQHEGYTGIAPRSRQQPQQPPPQQYEYAPQPVAPQIDFGGIAQLIKVVGDMTGGNRGYDEETRKELENVKLNMLQMQSNFEKTIIQLTNQFTQALQQQQQQMQMMMQQMQQQTQALIQQQQQQTKDMIDAILKKVEEEAKPGITPADLERMKTDMVNEFLRRQLEDMQKKYEELIKASKEEREKMYEELRRMQERYEKALREAQERGAIDKYQADTYRLTADALKTAAEVIKTKEPIKYVAKLVVTPEEGIEKGKFKPKEELSTAEDIADLIPDEFVEEGGEDYE